LRAATGSEYKTIQEKAARLKIGPTLLSRYLLGDRFVSANSAQQIAVSLYPDSPEDQRSLIEKLLAARPAQTEGETLVQSWFETRGHKGFLMVVLFNEPPVLKASSDLVEDVARAVADGLSYAMMLPFHLSDIGNDSLPVAIRNYVKTVAESITDLYSALIESVLKHTACTWLENDDPAKRTEQTLRRDLIQAAARIRFYQVKEDDDERCHRCARMPAIGFRLFYCRDHHDDAPQGNPELWQWNSTPGGDTMLQRRVERFEISAVESLLYPVPQVFERLAPDSADGVWALPTNAQLDAFHQASRKGISSSFLPTRLGWEEAEVANTNLSKIIDDLVDKHRPEATPSGAAR
jgi:hypothetical protein